VSFVVIYRKQRDRLNGVMVVIFHQVSGQKPLGQNPLGQKPTRT